MSQGVVTLTCLPKPAWPPTSCAGKSGTTTGNNDIWFVGYTPYYTAGVWAGYDLNQKMKSSVEGTSFHKDIWRKIMTRVHENLTDPGFQPPESVETATICRKSGKLAVPGVCDLDPRGSAIYTEYFAKGTRPTEVCNVHVAATLCAESGQLSTDYCPNKVSSICVTLPAGETGETDDSFFALPTETCTLHQESSTIIGPGSYGPDSSYGPGVSFGPGYVPSNPGGVVQTVPEFQAESPSVPTVPQTAPAPNEPVVEQPPQEGYIQQWREEEENLGGWY